VTCIGFSAESNSKGEAIIIVDNKTYTLPLKKCYSATNTEDGKTHEAFIIATHLSRKSKETGPRFSALGSKADDKTKASYRLQIDGGISKGGTGYRGKMPFESFKDNKLVFEGKAKSIRKENKKLVKELAPINITVSCNE
jgi:hypothetical protein